MTPQEWKVSLRDYIDTRINAVDIRFAITEKAMEIAHENNESRWTAHLEVTDALEKRINSVEQNKLNVGAHETLDERIQAIEKQISNILGRLWAISIGMIILGMIVAGGISIILHFI